jgi:integrase
LIEHLDGLGRRPTTLAAYRAALRSHLTPALGDMPLVKVAPEDVERLIGAERRRGVAAKTTLNALGFLHAIFEFGIRRGWCRRNPCKLVDKPRVEPSADIRFLDHEELEALVRATPDATDRTLFLAAALTGMRQGELLALRWRDIDWPARRVRVRVPKLRPPQLGRTENAPRQPRRPACRPPRDRARASLSAVGVHARRRPRLLPRLARHRARPLRPRAPLQARPGRDRRAGCALSRPAPHVRHPHGRGGRPVAHAAGVARPPRLSDDPRIR